MPETKWDSVDAYIASFPRETQKLLEQVRQAIHKAAPEASEIISYNMPAFELHGNLVYYAALKNHIGFYPTSTGIEAFKEELSHYQHSKGAVQFPKDQPMPIDLIKRITQYRVRENLRKLAKKQKSKNE